MILSQGSVTELSESLVEALQREADLLDQKEQQMERLREAVMVSDDAALEALMATIAHTDIEQSRLDMDIARRRAELSDAISPGRPPLRLRQLARALDGDSAGGIERLCGEIFQRLRRLRRRHLETAILLAECSRINRLLLDTLLGRGSAVETYDAGGRPHGQRDGGLLNTER
ncbi:MAG: hypothetical protein ABFD92_05335 [Planctomycetaceae bacterium]|nr:hypothetical protein [Planctomycetaceae bacterium]